VATTEEVADKVRALIRDMSPLGPQQAQPQLRLVEDLGYDSVAFLELALTLESEFGLEVIDEEQAAALITVGDIEALMIQLVAPAAA
jgi:acyl carrier protein